jgi:Xaa-Pro aminopeptidase
MTSAAGEFEKVGAAYDSTTLRSGQDQLRLLVQQLSVRIRPGMQEGQARQLANEMLSEAGFERRWHPSLVRFGEATLCSYLKPSRPDRMLEDDDIFFIDLGAVWRGQEADAGATFAVGADPDHHEAATAARELWTAVAELWAKERLNGQQLYSEAERLARNAGWRLNLDIQGHRISDFPHAAHGTPDLGAMTQTPGPDLWILEIQIAHPTRPFGAFHEDLLTCPPRSC